MVIAELISAIVDAVIGYAIGKGSDKLSEKVREKLGLDPTKNAWKAALRQAFTHLEEQHSDWVASFFDASFFEHEGAPVLAQFLFMNGRPDPSELARRWSDSLNMQGAERRTHSISELEPIALDFLADLTGQLKQQEALRDLNESRALDQIAEDMQVVRQHLEAEKATFGTCQDYLRWLVDRNLYLDPRGTFQTQRQVRLKLDAIYISLRAQSNDSQTQKDRSFFDEAWAHLETESKQAQLTAQEREDGHDLLQKRFEARLDADKSAEILELAEVINRSPHVVILGDPGSGKTTLLRYLALQHASALLKGQEEAGKDLGKTRFPLVIRIAEYAMDGIWKNLALSDFLVQCFAVHECPKRGLADLLQRKLEQGTCLVLLDGLDEIISADERSGVVSRIEDFVRRHSHRDNRFVITSRVAGYFSAPLGRPFLHATVREMDDAQIQGFLEHWCYEVEKAQTPDVSEQEHTRIARREIEGIMQALQNPGVHRLAVNPLLLSILVLIHRTGARLPQKRIELYKLAADTLARTWRIAQGVEEAELYKESALLKEHVLTSLLGILAFWLHTQKPTGIATEHEVYEVLGEAWANMNGLTWDPDSPHPAIQEEIGKFLSAVHKHTGLFVERAPRRYGFLHLTFEEYYVARHLVAKSRKRAKLIRQHVHQPRWEEPILLAIGFVGLDYPEEASDLIESAILAQGEEAQDLGFTSSQYEALLGRDFLFGLRCLADNIPVRHHVLRQLILRLADELLSHTNAARFTRYRQALEETLRKLSNSEGVLLLSTYLCKPLQDPLSNLWVRRNAAVALGRLGTLSSNVTSALLSVLQDQQADFSARINAADALRELRTASPDVTGALLSILQDQQTDPSVGRDAVDALSRLGAAFPGVTSALLSVLQDQQVDHEIRSNAAFALGQLGTASLDVISALLSVLQDQQVHLSVHREVTFALGELTASPDVTKLLLSVLQDQQVDHEIRRSASLALGRQGITSFDVTTALLSILQDQQMDPMGRSNAAYALGMRYMRHLGIASLDVTTALLSVLRDLRADHSVRSGAAYALGHLGITSPDVTTALLSVFQDQQVDPWTRRNAAIALGHLGITSPAVTTALLSVFQDQRVNHEVRSGVIEALRHMGQLKLLLCSDITVLLHDLFREAAGEKGWFERQEIAQLFGRLNLADDPALAILWQGLQDEDNNVRAACVQALARIGKEQDALRPLLEKRLFETLDDHAFEAPDNFMQRPAYDYAYEGLWSLVVGDEQDA